MEFGFFRDNSIYMRWYNPQNAENRACTTRRQWLSLSLRMAKSRSTIVLSGPSQTSFSWEMTFPTIPYHLLSTGSSIASGICVYSLSLSSLSLARESTLFGLTLILICSGWFLGAIPRGVSLLLLLPESIVTFAERFALWLNRGLQVAIQATKMPTQTSTVEQKPPGISSPRRTLLAIWDM